VAVTRERKLAIAERAVTGSWLGAAQSAYYATSDGPPGCFRWGFGRGTGCLFEHGEFEAGALFAGPVLAYAAESWWVALTVMPQLPAMKQNGAYTGSDDRELLAHEKLNARLLFSFHL
jgi:hypothetical protein